MSAFAAIIGTSTVIRHVQHLVLKVAEFDTPVLVTGEAGTGKELVARAIHEKSARAAGPFVPVKCGSMSEELLESELFGIAREGALSSRQGCLDMANGGTLFFDDISKVSVRVQGEILRLLQEGKMVHPATGRTASVNVRLVCATTQDIENLVRQRAFREDLYYRLASCALYIPPLRERREDISPLVEHFVEKHNHLRNKAISGISPDAMEALLQHDWLYNIRELENLIERIVVLKNSGSIEVCDLPPRLRCLVTDNIDTFYDRVQAPVLREPSRSVPPPTPRANPVGTGTSGSFRTGMSAHGMNDVPTPSMKAASNNLTMPYVHQNQQPSFSQQAVRPYEETSDIDQFIKKEIDLGSGIDFYRVVEEFENRLIAEALRRTNHNKNRAAQLLSMNRTTLVEKLKKRSSASSVKVEPSRVKRNSAFTIFDGLGNEETSYDALSFMTKEDTDGLGGR